MLATYPLMTYTQLAIHFFPGSQDFLIVVFMTTSTVAIVLVEQS